MGQKFRIELPPEPSVGTIVRLEESGRRFIRRESSAPHVPQTGWVELDASGNLPVIPDEDRTFFSWGYLLDCGELEDITPERTWCLPEPPPIGTYVVAYMTKGFVGNIWLHMNDGPHTAPYFWTPAISRTWGELLAEYGEVHEWRGPSPSENDIDSWRVERD